jgi:lipopolysaccharide export system permease protein
LTHSTELLRKTSILLLRAFLGPLAVTFPVALFVLDMQFLWVYADDFMGKGIEPWVIAKMIWFASARIVNLALPLAVLVASIMALGNLSERNELTALQSAGMPLLKIFRPLIVLMLIISGGALWFSSSAWPNANVKFRSLLYSVTRQKPALNIRPSIFYTGIEGFAIRVASKDSEGMMTDILIHDHRNLENGSSRIIRAEKGKMTHDSGREELIIELYNGSSYEEQTEKNVRRKAKLHPHITSTFESQTLRIDLHSLDFDLADEGLFRRSYEMMSLPQLQDAIDSLGQMAEIERTEILKYGRRAVRMINDSISIPTTSFTIESDSSLTWMAALSRVEKNNIFSKAKELSRNQMRGIENALEKVNGRNLRRDRHAIEWHRKFILAISCLVLFFVGSSLGALIRKGGLGMPVVIAIGVFLTYYIISMVGEQMVKSGALPPAIGMWLSTIVLVPFAIILTYFAMKGGRQYSMIFPKIFSFYNKPNPKDAHPTTLS